MKTKSRCVRSLAALFCPPLLLLSTAFVQADDTATAAQLERIAAGEHRSAANKARDAHRHPVETLLWFGLRPNMTVVEITPGGGWYTEILAPFLKDEGRYYAAGPDVNSPSSFARNMAQRFQAKLDAAPELYGAAITTVLAAPDHTEIAPPGSADMVLTFRNVHNWMDAGTADAIFAAMFRALKPGGILGVVEHRADAAQPQDPRARSGYVTEEYVIALANKAGFELAGRSEINANPKDSKDHPQGVWMLPPNLSGGEQDRARYLAIGESDRMTLRFIKPN